MSESQIEKNEKRKENLGKFLETMPEAGKNVIEMVEIAYKDGAIDSKTKRLMALGIGLAVGCENCTLGQATGAIELGATKEEILETIQVVISMRGTTGAAESLKVIQLLDELEKL
ncbi:carboxymuconolactone decarboxylase family protein [Desulfovibrio sp. JC010]|uniref:carboxymuconolactone decarboxylase family protein n=1 Tax=Desulfovibrio sp. JC010 TaxID=2593641 RepID=UPI0013D8B28F|nr:carboxymuconolactone decarboxylase family protein [Desulfovibrio sp. JC010]